MIIIIIMSIYKYLQTVDKLMNIVFKQHVNVFPLPELESDSSTCQQNLISPKTYSEVYTFTF